MPERLLRLTSGQFDPSVLDRFAEIEFRYEGQLYLAGRDATIVAHKGELLSYLDGAENMSTEFAVVDGYDYVIHRAAKELTIQ